MPIRTSLLFALVSLLLPPACPAATPYAASSPAASPKVTSASKLVASPASAAVGSLVTLTATVQSSAGQPLTVGSVAFYNGTALLGSSQVIGRTSGGGVVGTAVWRTRSLPPGTDSLTAVYSGPDGASTSSAVKVSVTGAYPSATALAAAGVQGSYALTGTVLGEGAITPTGSVVFTDNQTNTKLGTVALDPTTLLQGFVTGSTPSVGSYPFYSAVGDVNGDGIPDIVEALNEQAILVLIGNGDGTFKAPQTVDGNVDVYLQLALGDFNGDGRLDIAAVAYTSIGYAVNIYLGNGNGTFAAAVSYPTGSSPALCVGDFNGDGKLDIAVGGPGGNPDEIGILIGNGDGTFQAAISFSAGAGPQAIATADLNGDGKLDLVLANYDNQTVSVLLGNGNGTFGTEVTYPIGQVGYYATGIAIGDINGDGYPDLAINSEYDSTISLLTNNGKGVFTAQTPLTTSQPSSVAMADVNGDGKLDILDINYTYPQNVQVYSVGVFLGNGNGTFQNEVSYPVGNQAYALNVADFNNDGRIDALTSNYGDGTLSILLNEATQTATLTGVTLGGATADKVTATYGGNADYASSVSNALLLPSNPSAAKISFAASPASGPLGTVFTLTATVTDSSGNPLTGGTVAFHDGSAPATTSTLATVQVVEANGTATWKTNQFAAGAHSLTAIYSGTDSYKSITSAAKSVTVAGKSASATIFSASGIEGSYALAATVDGFGYATPSGSVAFTDTTTGTTLGTVALSAANAVSTFVPPYDGGVYGSGGNNGIQTVLKGDLNNDGIADMAIANSGGGSVFVMIGKGDGTFNVTQVLAYNSPVVGPLALADLNGDGKLDLIVAVYDSNNDSAVRVFLGNGDGTFQTATPFTIDMVYSGSPSGVDVGDLNGDGKVDVVVSDENYNQVYVLLGNGDGTLQTPVGYATGNGPNSIVVRDFNGDGKPDVATAGGNQTVTVINGNGDGTLGASQTIGILNGSYYLTAADVNGDGKPDLLVGAAGDEGFFVILNQGNGNFAAPVAYATANNPNGMAVADVTGDSIADVVASQNNGAIAVLAGNGNGTFQPAVYYNSGSSYNIGIAVADFNGDGRNDIASLAPDPGYLSVFLGEVVNGVSLSNVTLTGTGADTVEATYNGDGNFTGSVSNSLAMPAKPVGTKTTVAATPASGALGSLFTLKATVASGTTPVTAGAVTFYSGTLALGTVQLTSQSASGVTPGTATLYTRALPPGANSIVAKYSGPDTLSASTSSAATVTVTGAYPTATTLAVTGSAGNYTMTASVAGYAPVLPTGKVNFNDTTANVTLATGTLAAGSAGFTLNGSNPAANLWGCNVVVGDFNRDGELDSASCAYGALGVAITLGNGDGTFQPQQTFATGINCEYLAVGDMNGDGKLDLVFTDGSSQVGVLLGNGDGTFGAPGSAYTAPSDPTGVRVADLNGDGKLDVVTADRQSNVVSIFYGNGDGTLQAPVNYGTGGGPSAIAIGDFNGDGRPDIVIGSVAYSGEYPIASALTVLMGSLGGTFQTSQISFSDPYNGFEGADLTIGDFNGDGKLDLAFTNSGIGLMLGNGDGTFAAPVSYNTESSTDLAAADINGDGFLDLVSTGFGYVNVLLGNGNGTFQAAQTFADPNGGYYNSVVTGDFNNDHRPDIIAAGNSGYFLLLNQLSEAATVTGVSASGSGLHNVVATYSGDTHFTGSTSPAQQLTASPAAATLTLADEPGASEPYGTAASVVATVAGPAGAPTPTGSVSYTVDGGAAQTATLSGGSATLALGSALSVAKHTIAATYSGDTIYGKVTQSISLTIVKANQTVSFNQTIGNQTYGAGPFGVSATATSGLAATVSVVSGPATISGTTLTLTGAGTVVLQAAQPGNADYNAAPTVQQSFTVAKAPLAVVVANATKVYGSANPAFSATITGLVGSDTVTATESTTATTTSPVGTYSITATLSGAALANYTPTITPGTLTITKQPLTVTVANASRNYGAANPAFSATITGLQGTDTATATFSTTATATSAVGAYSITATVTGSDLGNYNVTVVNGTLTVAPAPLTIAVANATKVYGQANPAFTSTLTGVENGDTVPVAYSTSATNTTGVGSYQITASTTDANYAATVVPGTLTITKATLTIAVNSLTKVYGSANPAFTGTVTGLLFNDTVTTTYTTTAAQYSYVGAYPITASISGGASANYNAVVTNGTLTVTQALLTIVVNNGTKVYGTANPAFTGTVTGILNHDAVVVTYSSPATAATTVGSYANIGAAISGGPAVNYNTKVTDGTLTITPAPLTATVNPATKTYGAANPAFATTFVGLVNGDTLTSTYSTTATAASPVGSYTVGLALSGALLPDYTPTIVSGTLTVTKATLTVTAANASAAYGTAIPSFTYSIAGFVNGDPASVVTGTASETTTAAQGSAVGTYPIAVSQGTLAAANYGFAFVSGTLTIVVDGTSTALAASPNPSASGQAVTFTATVTAASGPTPTGGTVTFTHGGVAYPAVSLVNGVATLTTAADLTPGTHSIRAVYSGSATDAASTSAPLTQTVLIATTTALASTPNPSTTGQAVTFTATVTAASGATPTGTVTFTHGGVAYPAVTLVNGVATLTTSADLTAGTHTIRAIYAGSATDATSTSAPLTQTVNAP